MTLAEMMRSKADEIYKIGIGDSITAAAKVLVEEKIGALLVEDETGQIAGILSERDIMSGLPPHGADLHNVVVSELMTADIIHCDSSHTVAEAMELMDNHGIRHLPVYTGDQLVGLISLRDLVKSQISEVKAEADAMRQYIAS
jgi:CBS domain-containing protein